MIKKIVVYFEDGTKQEFSGGLVSMIERPAAKPTKDYSDDFLTAWEAYPRKIGKGAAWRAWDKVDVELDVVLEAIEQQKKKWDDPKYIPHMATWLNQKRWEDEVEKNDVLFL